MYLFYMYLLNLIIIIFQKSKNILCFAYGFLISVVEETVQNHIVFVEYAILLLQYVCFDWIVFCSHMICVCINVLSLIEWFEFCHNQNTFVCTLVSVICWGNMKKDLFSKVVLRLCYTLICLKRLQVFDFCLL